MSKKSNFHLCLLTGYVELYLSSIVIAEYSVKGDIADLPLIQGN